MWLAGGRVARQGQGQGQGQEQGTGRDGYGCERASAMTCRPPLPAPYASGAQGHTTWSPVTASNWPLGFSSARTGVTVL